MFLVRSSLLERLDEALALHLLAEAPSQAGSFRFAHGLIRETLYNDLSAVRLARCTGRSAGRSSARGTGPGGAGLLELAHHFIEAAPAGDAQRALDYAERAGHEALRALAYEAARRPVRRRAAGPGPPGEPDEKRRAVEPRWPAARRRCTPARTPPAPACSRRSRWAKQLGDNDLLGRAALVALRLGLSPGIVDSELAYVLEEALAAADPADSAAPRARLLVRLAVATRCQRADRPPRGARRRGRRDRACGSATRRRSRSSSIRVWIATSGCDTLERGLAWAHELFALSEQLGDHEAAVRARIWHIDLLLELDDLPAADMAIATLDRIATDVRDPRARSYIPLPPGAPRADGGPCGRGRAPPSTRA